MKISSNILIPNLFNKIQFFQWRCIDEPPFWIKNVGFPLNLGQRRTYDYRKFTSPTPSGQKFLMEIMIFRLCEIYFALEWDKNDR